jgi:UDPglucose--hexose-1-phosphate uridylyltransferase
VERWKKFGSRILSRPQSQTTRHPDYADLWIFDNDFAALLPQSSEHLASGDSLLQQEQVSGKCRVMCFSPDHSKTLPELSIRQLRAIGHHIAQSWTEEPDIIA